MGVGSQDVVVGGWLVLMHDCRQLSVLKPRAPGDCWGCTQNKSRDSSVGFCVDNRSPCVCFVQQPSLPMFICFL